MRKLQVALDLLDIEKALEIALDVADYVDYVEAGTPLIKMHGMKAVEKLSDEVDKPVIADLKTMDTGKLEAEMAFSHGAYGVTVLAAAYPKTIKDVIETASKYGGISLVDTIGLPHLEDVLSKIEAAGAAPTYLLIHSGIDMQEEGITPDSILSRGGDITRYGKLAVAGGITVHNIDKLLHVKEIELFIVGGGITKAENPREAAMMLRERLNQL